MDVKCPRDLANIERHNQTLRTICDSISRGICKQKLPYIKSNSCSVLHLVNLERLVKTNTRLQSQDWIQRGFSDPMVGLKLAGKQNPGLLIRFTEFINTSPK